MLKGGKLRRALGCIGSPGMHAMLVYRFGRWLRPQVALVRIALEPFHAIAHLLVKCVWGIDIPRACSIGPGLYIGHFGGIILSPETVMGSDCNLSHDVTIGVAGEGSRLGVPVIGDDVYIAPGAKLFGKIRIGNDVKIGANAVVYKDVPDHAVVVLDPGFRVVSFKGKRRKAAPADALQIEDILSKKWTPLTDPGNSSEWLQTLTARGRAEQDEPVRWNE
jgi:serine O-acetyltransferase